jgi:hypothetical protein
MPIVGSFAGASARAYGLGAGVQIGDFESIQTITLTGTQASIEFTSIPQTYTHLQVRGILRGSSASTDLNNEVQFNSDTSANYSVHGLYGTGSAAVSYADVSSTFARAARITAASSSASMFGAMVTDILDYANTNKYKTMRTITGNDQNGSGLVFVNSSNWRSTSAITSIKFYPATGSFVQYSSLALYGVKA